MLDGRGAGRGFRVPEALSIAFCGIEAKNVSPWTPPKGTELRILLQVLRFRALARVVEFGNVSFWESIRVKSLKSCHAPEIIKS